MGLRTHDDPAILSMVMGCAEFAKAFNAGLSPRWVTFMGKTGTGKTHCGTKLWKHLSQRVDWSRTSFKHQIVYWPALVAKLRYGESYKLVEDMAKWPVLLLDDIGAERDTTGFASEQLNTLLGSRPDKWTILTSNLMLDQIGKIDLRIADRIIRYPNIYLEINAQSHSLR